MEGYEYDVVIRGLDGIPLRTTNAGAHSLLEAFHPDGTKIGALLDGVDKGTPFNNTFIKVTQSNPKSPKKAEKKTAKKKKRK